MIDYELIAKNLKSNNMLCTVCDTKADVLAAVKSLLPKGATISSGGSMSLIESGVFSLITSGDYNYLDRSRQGITEQEKQKVFESVISADYYFASANALTVGGDIINVDGFSNRITAITFGPKKVILIVGKNKIVESVSDGFLRVKRIAAPKNCVRLKLNTPCAKLGHCVSLEAKETPAMTDGCKSLDRICCSYSVNSQQRIADRIHVIICKEDLGY